VSISERLKRVLVNTVLYYMNLYPREKLEEDLDSFLREVDSRVCYLLRASNYMCYSDIREQYPLEDAIRVYEEIKRKIPLKDRDKYFLLYISHYTYKPETLLVRDKVNIALIILLYGKPLGVESEKIMKEAIEEIEKILGGIIEKKR
jgi:hypothetical protein